MGSKRCKHKRRRPAGDVVQASSPPPAPTPLSLFGGDGWFMRFALAFLIIFVLLWLLAPTESEE